MISVQDVADFFIDMSNNDKTNKYPMTIERLNMLLYFAQGWYLARYDEPLFLEDFYALPDLEE